MTDASLDRRSAPRFAAALSGELACGQALAAIRILDISESGCSVVLVDRSDVRGLTLAPTGILHIKDAFGGSGFAILPVRLRADYRDGTSIGLQFLVMSSRQSGRLDSLLAPLRYQQSMAESRAEGRQNNQGLPHWPQVRSHAS